ncbi:uncharacterized protein BP5553_06748 [Venustampulla echinocandica]|uniref:MARVEL domain-containing protein n=1 Tax=Venustampulla echinocandica TaxID=2656787 RepID=A0A370TKS5_9HELO|nr:uncharacterized protein BP5553_06748 [Venustampulla echinocandica]RDL36136.1 hypothetical protein BP5553_06748 [Venustampulla echinocandica]
MGLFGKKHNSTVTTSSFASKEPLRNSTKDLTPTIAEYEKKDLRYKRVIRVLRFISRFVSLVLNGIMMGTMSYSIVKYYLTKNRVVAGNLHPWGSTSAKVWPSFMLLAIATVTFFLNLITLCAYCCGGVKAANKASNFTSYAGYLFTAAHFVSWAIAAGLYRFARTGNDLWGYSCSNAADSIQEQVASFLDFGKLCTMQNGTWFISIIEAIVYLLTFVVTIYVVRRASQKKKLGKIKESLSMQTWHAQNTYTEPTYNGIGGNGYMRVAV